MPCCVSYLKIHYNNLSADRVFSEHSCQCITSQTVAFRNSTKITWTLESGISQKINRHRLNLCLPAEGGKHARLNSIQKLVIPPGSGYPVPWMVSSNPSMEPGFQQSMQE
jgi:hypothetical protein